MESISRKSRITNAWAMYDWANSAFATTILAAILPVYYQSVAGAGLPGNTATVYWGYTTSAALLIAAVLSPALGAMADFKGAKKLYLGYFAALGITGTGLLYFAGEGQWLLASLFFILGNVGYAGANVFYDALLTHIAKPQEMDKVSARGFAFGYLGGGILLAINLWMIAQAPQAQSGLMMRWAFVSVAAWWLVFSIPLWRAVPESPAVIYQGEEGQNAVRVSFQRLSQTFKDLRKLREAFKFLVALWLYTDGIGTITKMAVIFGAEIGIRTGTLVGTILAIQFVSVPFSFGFGWLAGKIGPKRGIYLGLSVFILVTLGAFLMRTDAHFWLLGLGVAVVQGGTQALTRSLGARMVPKSKSGEFFGFVSVTVKFAGIAGPAIFALAGQLLGSSRLAFLSIILFFIAGIVILSRVDVEEGMRLAQEEEERISSSLSST
jgi:UMF1 family MFS transporter